MAIYLDGVPISAPVVKEAISGGKAQITGSFTAEEAKEIEKPKAAEKQKERIPSIDYIRGLVASEGCFIFSNELMRKSIFVIGE